MKKTTKASSGKQKVKEMVKKKAALKKSAKTPEGIKQSIPPTQESNLVSLVENKPLDGSITIDHLPFKDQANMIFNPLQGFNQKQIIGKLNGSKDPFAPTAFIVEKKPNS